MKIRNKILTILITLIFLLSFNLISCTGQLDTSSTSSSSQPAATTKAPAMSTQITTTTSAKSSEQATTTTDTSKQTTAVTTTQAATTNEEKNSSSNSNPASGSSKLAVHFIDVGQGDSALIQTPNGLNILIDGGPKSSSGKVVSYLKSLGIEKLNVVISTHPHEDHIGGLISVINSFDIDNVIDSGVSHTSATFKNYLNAIKAKNINYLTPYPGESFDLEANVKLVIYGPYSRSGNDLNNSSVVAKLTYGSTSFLFEGDAESKEEKQLISGKLDLSADVLKVGHHGSKSSSTLSFLKKVSPKISVISVGKGNSYGHPASTTIDNLLSVGSVVYRTDTTGDIIIESDGSNINVVRGSPYIPDSSTTTTTKSSEQITTTTTAETTTTITSDETTTQASGPFVGSKNSDVYHYPSCSSAKKIKPENLITFNSVEEAKAADYKPCKKCNPPG